MDFFVEVLRLHAEFVDVADLCRGRKQIEDLDRDRVVVQDDLSSPEYVHRTGGEEFRIP